MFPIPRDCGPLLRVQVVVAHPDDETFGCGSLLLHAARAGAVTAVTCATRGEAGEVTDRVTVPDGGLAELREAELREAARLLGVRRVDVLGFGDSGMEGEPARRHAGRRAVRRRPRGRRAVGGGLPAGRARHARRQ